MDTQKVQQTSVTRSAASIPVILLIGALCGSALASTEIQEPCPESEGHADDLHTILDNSDVKSPMVRTVDGKNSVVPSPLADARSKPAAEEAGKESEGADASKHDSGLTDFTSRLPGVSANDMPRFRRHMFRTDI